MSPRPSSSDAPLRRRRLAVVALLATVPVVAVACGETGKIAVSDAAPSTTSTTEVTSTTEAETTTEAGTTAEAGTTSDGGTGDGSTATADEESSDDSWSASPGEFRGQDGLRVAYTCPPAGTLNTIWGTGPFTDDSSVCTAAVFAGLITTEGGGRVVVVIAPGESTYAGGEANGVTASDYGTWAGSFTFP